MYHSLLAPPVLEPVQKIKPNRFCRNLNLRYNCGSIVCCPAVKDASVRGGYLLCFLDDGEGMDFSKSTCPTVRPSKFNGTKPLSDLPMNVTTFMQQHF